MMNQDAIQKIEVAEAMLRELIHQPRPGALLRERRAVAMKNLALLADLRAACDRAMAEAVTTARSSGGSYDWNQPTWEQIGRAIGITKQSAQARYRSKIHVV